MAKKKAAAKKPATKTAKKKATPKKTVSKKAVRYSAEQKAEIVAFVQAHNKKHGRGGQSTAVKEFGVSAPAISSWLKAGAKPAPKKKAVAKKTAPPENKKPAGMGGKVEALRKMAVIQEEIEKFRAEFEKLKGML